MGLFSTTKNKVITALLLLNGVLIAAVVGVIPLLLFLSLCLNGLLVYTARRFSIEKEELYEDMDEILDNIDGFAEHLEQIYDMSEFHGEPAIKELIVHSYEIVNKMADIQDKYGFAVLSEELEYIEKEKE